MSIHYLIIPVSSRRWLVKPLLHRPTWHRFCSSKQQQNFLSTIAKVKGHESCLWSEGSTGAKVPWNESSWTFRHGSECSMEWKFHGSKSSLYGLFAPRNESAEERKGLIPLRPYLKFVFSKVNLNSCCVPIFQLLTSTVAEINRGSQFFFGCSPGPGPRQFWS